MNTLFLRDTPATPGSADFSLLGPALDTMADRQAQRCLNRLAWALRPGLTPLLLSAAGHLCEHHRAVHGGEWTPRGGLYAARRQSLPLNIQLALGLSDPDPLIDLTRLDETTAQALWADIRVHGYFPGRQSITRLSVLSNEHARPATLAQVMRQGLTHRDAGELTLTPPPHPGRA